MKEVWKDIIGYEGLYQISNLGRVKSLNYNHTRKEQILKPHKDKDGYLELGLNKDGKRKSYRIHRLVANAFIPNEDLFKTQINHIDENKENNNVNNLEWCDVAYNINFGTHEERRIKTMKENGTYKKLGTILTKINVETKSKEVVQYSLDGTYIQSFPSSREASRITGIAQSSISDCCLGKLKKSHNYIWKYVE